MVRTTLGAEVETSVTVSGSESVDFLTAGNSTTVAAGSTEQTTVRPPSGKVYILLALRLLATSPSGSTSGKHRLTLRSETAKIGVVNFESNHSDNLIYNNGFIEQATNRARPTAPGDQTGVVKGLRADASNGFQVLYANLTDASQTDARQIRLWVREIQVSD